MLTKRDLIVATLSLLLATAFMVAFSFSATTSSLPVHNIDTGEDFATIQAAIDDADTLDGHRISVDIGYNQTQNLDVYKSLALTGQDRGNTTIFGDGTADVVLIYADDVKIKGFTIRNSGYVEPGAYGGIGIINADNITIEDNNLVFNDDGIWLYGVTNSFFANNNVSHNIKAAVYTRYCSNNTFFNNTLSNNPWGIVLTTGTNSTNMYNNTILSSAHTGIQIGLDAHSNNVTSNTITDNDYGILVLSQGNNTVSSNNASSNEYIGIGLDTTSNNLITDNVLSSNKQAGIYAYNSNKNVFANNSITYNGVPFATSAGLILEDSNNNRFYHNNFVDNDLTHVDITNSFNNTWNCSYPSGGNFWSDYSGSDTYSGPYQNETGSDGIGDTPYIVDVNNQDNYPLMNPWPHDHIRIRWTPTNPYPMGTPSPVPREWEPVNVTASIILNKSAADRVVLSYRVDGGEWWNATLSQDRICDLWTVVIPGQQGNSTVEFFIKAYAKAGNEYSSPTEGYYNYTVRWLLDGDINGDGKVDGRDIFIPSRDFGKWVP